jgi:hypothetical protein
MSATSGVFGLAGVAWIGPRTASVIRCGNTLRWRVRLRRAGWLSLGLPGTKGATVAHKAERGGCLEIASLSRQLQAEMTSLGVETP